MIVLPGAVKPTRSVSGWRFSVWIGRKKVTFPPMPGKSAIEVKQIMRDTVEALNVVWNKNNLTP